MSETTSLSDAEAHAWLVARSASERTEMRARRGHLFGRFRPPGDAPPDERCELDVHVGELACFWGHDCVSRLHAEWIGSHGPDGTFVWGPHDANAPEASTGRVQEAARSVGPLSTLAEAASFRCSPDAAEIVASLIVGALGALGPYPWRVGDRIAWLAVAPPTGGPESAQWCTFCGSHQHRLVAGPLCTVCAAPGCLPALRELAAEIFADPAASTVHAPDGFSCVFCTGDQQVLQHRYVGICSSCLDFAASVLT